MPNEQVKGTLLAVGVTAASTALLVGGIIGIHNTYESATGVDPSTVIDFRAKQASDAAAGGTGEFSDHCLVMREGYMIAVPSASWTTDEQGNPVMDALPQTLNWQWVNTTRQSPGWSTFLDPLTVGNTYPKVATPDGRTQDNLNEWFDVIKKHVPGSYPVPGMLQVGYKADSRPQHVLAAPGTKTATINKPSNLDGGYVTWVWTVEKNNQPEEWGKYLINDAVSDGWAAENEVVEIPETPKPTPSVTPTPSVVTPSPEPSVTTPSPKPSVTTPAPSPSESSTLPPAPVENNTPTTPPQSTPVTTPKTPETQASLAHTGSMAAPLIEASVVILAGGLTIAFRKRNAI